MLKYFCISLFLSSTLLFAVNAQEMDKNINKKIYFNEIKSDGVKDIWTKDYIYDIKTQTKKELTSKYLRNVFNGIPRISYDQKYLAYFVKKDKNQFIYLLNLSNDSLELNLEVPMLSGELQLSKNLNYMTFYRNIDMYNRKTKEIYLVNVNSKEIFRITTNSVPDFNPTFSPDEEQLSFLEEQPTKTLLKSYNIKSKKISEIKVFPNTGYQLFQYLDNERVLLSSKDNQGSPFILNIKSGEIQKINLDRIYDISISPDGKRMVYLRAKSLDDPIWDLFITDMNGKVIDKILYSDNIDIFGPQWVAD